MQLKSTDKYTWELNNATGLLEKYDAVSGRLVAVERSTAREETTTGQQEVQLHDGSIVLVGAGVDVALINHALLEKSQYSPIIMDVICQKIAEGKSLTAICKEAGMPTYAAFCRWRRLFPEINQMLDAARRDRAEYLRDKVLEEATENMIDDIQVKKLRADIYKWAAGKDDPNKYEAKAEKMQVNVAPAVIVVQTGIHRGVPNGESSAEVKDVSSDVVIDAATISENDSTVEMDDLTTVGPF